MIRVFDLLFCGILDLTVKYRGFFCNDSLLLMNVMATHCTLTTLTMIFIKVLDFRKKLSVPCLSHKEIKVLDFLTYLSNLIGCCLSELDFI